MNILSLALILAALEPTREEPVPWPAPMRQVQGPILSSPDAPLAHIRLPENALYIGARRWPLYNTVDAEMHLFVEAGDDRVVDRLYWVQFEAYLPTLATATYDFHLSDLESRFFGDYKFYVRARVGVGAGDEPEPGSDNDVMQSLLHEAGYTLPAEIINATLKHLVDPSDAREELMIIYIEDLEPTGAQFQDIVEAGLESELWADLSQGVLDRAQARINMMSKE